VTGRWVALLAATLAVGCRGSASDEKDAAGVGATRVPVALAIVARDSITEELALTGRLAPRPGGSALLAAPAAGMVRAVRVQIGDRVARGRTLIELDVPELVAEAEQRTSAAAQAEREAERQRRLLADGITSARQAEEAEAAARQAATAASAARDLLARTRIASPIAGRVQEILTQPGERVDAGAALAEVIASDTLDLVAAVRAADLRRLRTTMAASITEEGGSSPHPGWIAALAPGIDSATGAGEVVLRVPNRDGTLHAGAGAVGRVRLGVRRNALVVPDSAIVLQGDSAAVFTVGPDSVAHVHTVVGGARQGGRIEIQGDVKPGDQVVTTGAFGLADGMKVAPIKGARR